MSLFNKNKKLLTEKEVVDLITGNLYLYRVIMQGIEIDGDLVENTVTVMPDGLEVAITYLRENMSHTGTIDEIISMKDKLEQLLSIKSMAYNWYNIILDVKHNSLFHKYKDTISCNKRDYTELVINLAKKDYSPLKRMIKDAGSEDGFLFYLVNNVKEHQTLDTYNQHDTSIERVITSYRQLHTLYEDLIINFTYYGYFDFDKVKDSFDTAPVVNKDSDCSASSESDNETGSKDDKQELADIVADKVEERLKKCMSKQSNSAKNDESTNATPFIKARISDKNGLATVMLGYKDIVCLCSIPASTKNDETYFIIYKAGSGKGLTSSNISKEEFNNLKNLGLPYCTN